MPRPLRKEYNGAKYHVTARGNGRNDIFLCEDDYDRFIEQLTMALEKDGVILYAYAIIPNHYHLLVETPRGNLHGFIQRLNTAYSLYWRYKHRKPGHVFQGRYGAKLVAGDRYLLALTRYIHLNPVKGKQWEKVAPAERRRQLRAYRRSSYRAYVGEQGGASFTNLRWLGLMGGRTLRANYRRYRAYVEDMILKDDEDLREALSASRYAVGDEEFIKGIEGSFKTKRQGDSRDADVIWPGDNHVSLLHIDEAVSEAYGMDRKVLKTHGNAAGMAKGLAIELACAVGGISQRAAGRYYGGITCAAVGQQRRRLHDKIMKDVLLRQRFKQLVAKLNV